MLNIVFFSALVLYFLCSVCQFVASALKKDKFGKIAFAIFLIAFLLHTGYLIARAIIAVPVVLFTFVGVNSLMPGMHSYG